jgi:hypothetical protein
MLSLLTNMTLVPIAVSPGGDKAGNTFRTR